MNRKSTLLVLLAILSLAAVTWITRPTHFVPPAFATATTLEAAIGESAKDGRPVIAFYTADWCGPCSTLKRGPMTEPAIEALFARTHPVLIDCTNGHPQNDRFGVEGYPTLLEIRAGEEVSRIVGAVPAEELGAWLEAAVSRK